eukprot:GHRQ01022418.1.p1 GENE.GHRQ01022418.1~~GHRQ01022418.1.p1  ORF type:complete len:201 (-),score=47.07 GHRQ01022418.1:2-604(-)
MYVFCGAAGCAVQACTFDRMQQRVATVPSFTHWSAWSFVFCVYQQVHRLLSAFLQIRTIDRKQEVPHDGAMCDLLWSDPEDIDGWGLSPRGAGYLFGGDVCSNFSSNNKISLICRAHQLVMDGYKWMFHDQLVTVWSAPNYCYRCGWGRGGLRWYARQLAGRNPGTCGLRGDGCMRAGMSRGVVVPLMGSSVPLHAVILA